MDIIAEVRRRRLVSKESISSIARSLNISRPTVRKHLQSEAEPVYQRQHQPAPKLSEYKPTLVEWLEKESKLPKAQRRTAQRLFEGLKEEGYSGAYDSVQRFVKQWKAQQKRTPSPKKAFVPLAFKPGEVCQFDWSQETVELGGTVQTIKVAHFRLAFSRKMFVVAYPRETQEMVMDAHDRAFAFYGGLPKQMVYDNLKTVVDAVFVGKERRFNRRFMALANHYLIEPVACTPAAGWEKGQVENQVGNIREWLFTPRARFATFDDLNSWLALRCEELSARQHPTCPSRTVASCFEEEQPSLRPFRAPFNGYVEQVARVSSTCLVRVDRNAYSVPAQWAGCVVSARISAGQLEVVAEGEVVARHERSFGRDGLFCDPWHYLPILEKKPGALRHGVPFQDWALPPPVQTVREKLAQQDRGDRTFVELLLLAQKTGLDNLEVACELALEAGAIRGSVLLNEMRRLHEPVPIKPLQSAADWLLTAEPQADCCRYDDLLEKTYVH